MDTTTWWEAMGTLEHVYWLIAIPSSLIFVILMISTLFGSDADMEIEGNVEMDIDGDDGIGFQFISIKNLLNGIKYHEQKIGCFYF